MASLTDWLFQDKTAGMTSGEEDLLGGIKESQRPEMTQADETAEKMSATEPAAEDVVIPDSKKEDTSKQMTESDRGEEKADVTSSTSEVGEKVEDEVKDNDLLPGSDFMKESEKEGDVSIFSMNAAKKEENGDAPIKLNSSVRFDDAEIDKKVLEESLTEKVNLLLQTRESAGKDFDMNRDIEHETDKSKKETSVVKKLVKDSIDPVTEAATERLSKGDRQNVREMQRTARELDEVQNDVIIEKIARQHDEDNKQNDSKAEEDENINPYYRLKENRLPGSVKEVLDREERHVNENAMRLAVDFKLKTDAQTVVDGVS